MLDLDATRKRAEHPRRLANGNGYPSYAEQLADDVLALLAEYKALMEEYTPVWLERDRLAAENAKLREEVRKWSDALIHGSRGR